MRTREYELYTAPPLPPREQALLVEEIDSEVRAAFVRGQKNHLTDLGCSIVAIVGSFIAAVLAALGELPGWVTATIAALPGLCASLQRVIDFRGRAAWYFIKWAQLRDLSRNLKYGNVPLQDAAKLLGKIEETMEQRWSEFVKASSRPPSKD
jgi:hypothetical protein